MLTACAPNVGRGTAKAEKSSNLLGGAAAPMQGNLGSASEKNSYAPNLVGTPKIILSWGRPALTHRGAIIIDLRNRCFWRDGEARLTGGRRTTFRMMTALLVRAPGIVTVSEIAEYVWGDDADGGPETAEHMVTVIPYQHRALLAWFGARVVTEHGRGRRLEFIPQAQIRSAA